MLGGHRRPWVKDRPGMAQDVMLVSCANRPAAGVEEKDYLTV